MHATSEDCDDGNTDAGDGCSGTCVVECGFVCSGEGAESCLTVCGDNMVAGGEGCDDGNVEAGDGCSATCTVENGYSCKATACRHSDCLAVCGDGVQTLSEQCDDGNMDAGDGCSGTCGVECGYNCSQAGAIEGFANGGQLMGLYGCSCMQVLAYHTATSEQMVAFVETGGKETSTARQ